MHLTNFMKTVPDHAVQLVAVLVTICKQNTIADGQTRATSIAVQIAGFQDQKTYSLVTQNISIKFMKRIVLTDNLR